MNILQEKQFNLEIGEIVRCSIPFDLRHIEWKRAEAKG